MGHREVEAVIHIVGSKGVVFDEELGNSLLREYFGKPLGVSKPQPNINYKPPFLLSLYESLYLCTHRNMKIRIEGKSAECNDLLKYGESLIPRFRIKYYVYEDLRLRGYIVKSAMKFGADFAVYELGPGLEHAPYLVLVVDEDQSLDPVHIVRLGRLSHSVKKRLIIAVVSLSDGVFRGINYLTFRWIGV